jgi:hypothetical protein
MNPKPAYGKLNLDLIHIWRYLPIFRDISKSFGDISKSSGDMSSSFEDTSKSFGDIYK